MVRFVQAATNGDMQGLLTLLADDITLWSDGGGKVAAALNPIQGSTNVARFLVGVAGKAPPGIETCLAQVNGQTGAINYVDGRPQSVASLDMADGCIQAIRIVVNPDKLQRVPPLRQRN